MPGSAFPSQQDRIREFERLLSRKTMEVEILKEALDCASNSKRGAFAVAIAAEGRFPIKTICETICVALSNVAV